MAARNTSAALSFMSNKGPHADAVRSTLCAPATLASTLGDLAAVYAHYARFPATFKEQASVWLDLTLLATIMLSTMDDVAVAAALQGTADAGKQLAAALLPYTAHLLETADLSSAAWFDAWAPLVATLATLAVWPSPEAAAADQAAQRSVVAAEGLLRLLRALPPLGKLPGALSGLWSWSRIPLFTATAAAAAAASALAIVGRLPREQVQREAALQIAQQRALSALLTLLPITVDLLTVAAGQLAASPPGARSESSGVCLLAYSSALNQLVDLCSAVFELLGAEASPAEEQALGLQPEQLAAAAEAALRFAAQAGVLVQPLECAAAAEWAGVCQGLALVDRIRTHLLPAAKQEASAAPEPGGVRPSLQAQLRCAHTVCKFARVALAPGAAASRESSGGWGMSAEQLEHFIDRLLGATNLMLSDKLYAAAIPQGCAPLIPVEKRAVNSAALALSAASSAVVDLLPEGPARETQRVASLLRACRLLLAGTELGGALLAQQAVLAEQLVTGLVSAEKAIITYLPGTEVPARLNFYFGGVWRAVRVNRRLGPMMLGGAAGEALEAAVRQSLQATADEGSQVRKSWLGLLAVLTAAAEGCFDGNGRLAAARLQTLIGSPAGMQQLQQEGWEALQAVRAAADEWLAQEAQQQWRQEQLLLCAEAAVTRSCSNLACTNLVGASEAGLKAKQCAGCRCVRYCSTACQRVDWAAGHRAMCKRLQARQAASG